MALPAKKRRPTTKPVEARIAQRAKAEVKKNNSKKSNVAVKKPWWFEVMAISFFAFAVFLILSFLSVELRVLYPNNGFLTRNTMGPVGRLVGTLLSGSLGWCGIIPGLWIGCFSVYLWKKAKDGEDLADLKPINLYMLAGLIGCLASCAILIRLALGLNAGGSIGETITLPLVKLVNVTGTALIATTIFILSFALATQKTTLDIFEATSRLARLFFSLTLLTMPKVLFYFTLNSIILIHGLSVLFFGWFSYQLKKFFIKNPEPPKKNKRKIVLPNDPEPLLPEPKLHTNDVPDDDYTHVVVKRHDRSALEKNKKKIKIDKIKNKIEPDAERAPYIIPDLQILTAGEATVSGEDDETLRKKSKLIEAKLQDFGILGRVTHVHPGPVITLFEFEPAPGVKVGRISSLQDDLAMSLKAVSIRIIAPIPQRGTVGIEVPNSQRDIVRLRDCLENEAFLHSNSILAVPIGKDTYGEPVIADIAAMPHLLVAGATGTGKSVFINSLLISLLYRTGPEELGLILIDPKILELSVYESVPHLRAPVVTVPRQAKAVLDWATKEMERRYRLMHRFGVRSIDGFNEIIKGQTPTQPEDTKLDEGLEEIIPLAENNVVAEGTVEAKDEDQDDKEPIGVPEVLKPLPKLVIVIDELADLMLTVGRDIEESITRLAQKARAAGIHLIVATQRPSVDVITGLIKANFPARISFRVTSRIDSRTILDGMGAERLLGRGDMLFMKPGAQHVQRIHGAFVSDREVNDVVSKVKEWGAPQYDPGIVAACAKALEDEPVEGASNGMVDGEYDAFYDKAVELVVQNGKASTSMIQRAFRIGYNRAARIIEMMERDGVIGPMDGAKPREVLINSMNED
jgi:S-DNA-T family DNA segregation ATPase FtsK/SpoIIIE